MVAQEPAWLSRQIVEHAPDAIIVADREGVIRLWNAAAGAVFGYPVAEEFSVTLLAQPGGRSPGSCGHHARRHPALGSGQADAAAPR
jgi:PAS domain-containing protein